MELLEDWDFWYSVGIDCCGYDSVTDSHLIQVFIETSKDGGNWYELIAENLKLDKHYVCLLMGILSSASFCDYGTSPRSAWATHGKFEENLKKLTDWYERKWEEPFIRNDVTPSEQSK